MFWKFEPKLAEGSSIVLACFDHRQPEVDQASWHVEQAMLRLDGFGLYIVKLIVKSIARIARNGDVYLKRQNLVGLVANMFPHVSFTQRSVFLVVFLVIATSRPGLSGTSQRPGWSSVPRSRAPENGRCHWCSGRCHHGLRHGRPDDQILLKGFIMTILSINYVNLLFVSTGVWWLSFS